MTHRCADNAYGAKMPFSSLNMYGVLLHLHQRVFETQYMIVELFHICTDIVQFLVGIAQFLVCLS